MSRRAVYLDASAAVKLVTVEPETRALADYMLDCDPVYSSWALCIELGRATRRITRADEMAIIEAHALLARTTLVEVDHRIVHAAARVEPHVLHTLDAIHLATALELGEEIEAMVVYDRRLAVGARRHGIEAVAPGADV
jgi:predicted nucleic acid-binding protein